MMEILCSYVCFWKNNGARHGNLFQKNRFNLTWSSYCLLAKVSSTHARKNYACPFCLIVAAMIEWRNTVEKHSKKKTWRENFCNSEINL